MVNVSSIGRFGRDEAMERGALGKSREDYLEAILVQINKNGACRSTDVAQQLGFSKPSVSIALKKLEDEGYVVRDDWKVLLTEEGEKIALNTLSKHNFFKMLLKKAGVEEFIADEEACAMEHAISDDSFEKIKRLLCETGNEQ